jgi:hypothetical protein
MYELCICTGATKYTEPLIDEKSCQPIIVGGFSCQDRYFRRSSYLEVNNKSQTVPATSAK